VAVAVEVRLAMTAVIVEVDRAVALEVQGDGPREVLMVGPAQTTGAARSMSVIGSHPLEPEVMLYAGGRSWTELVVEIITVIDRSLVSVLRDIFRRTSRRSAGRRRIGARRARPPTGEADGDGDAGTWEQAEEHLSECIVWQC